MKTQYEEHQMAKWIYKIEESFEQSEVGMASEIAATIAFLSAICACLTWMMF